MGDLESWFYRALFCFCLVFAIIWWFAIITSTPAQCWFSKAPITCARTIEIQEKLERS